MENIEANVAEEAANETSVRDTLAAEYERMSKEAPEAEQTQEAAPEPSEAPEGETQEQRAERERDERGRFKSKSEGEGADQPEAQAQEEESAAEEEPENTKYAGPPPGWSVAAKAAFDELPDAVKASIAKREEEIDRGFAKLKEYKALEPYSNLARQHGVALPEMVERYYKAEQALQRDPKNALLWLAKSYGVNPAELAGEGQQQAQPGAQQQQKIDPALQPVIQPLLQEINALKQQLGRVDTLEQSIYADKFGQVSNQVESFFADPNNRYSEDVADQMVVLINQAHARGERPNLEEIYETACYMHPEVRTALINERLTADQKAKADKARKAADQARQAGASIAGGPSASQPPGTPDSDDLRATLESNYAAQVGRI